jgi:hypothetical protein
VDVHEGFGLHGGYGEKPDLDRHVFAASHPAKPSEPRARESTVKMDRQFVVEELKKQGESAKAQKVLNELPAKIDHEEHAALLEKYGIDPGELAAKAAKKGIASL